MAIKQKKIILYFEDDEFLARMYEKKFSMEGFECHGYPNPTKDPVGLAASIKPDLIIMDIIMPVMDGFAATQLLKSDSRTKDIPILGLDNLSQPEQIEQCRSLGMVDYLIKAKFTPAEVVHKVREVLGLPFTDADTEQKLPPLTKGAWHGQSVQDMLAERETREARAKQPTTPWWKRLFR